MNEDCGCGPTGLEVVSWLGFSDIKANADDYTVLQNELHVCFTGVTAGPNSATFGNNAIVARAV